MAGCNADGGSTRSIARPLTADPPAPVRAIVPRAALGSCRRDALLYVCSPTWIRCWLGKDSKTTAAENQPLIQPKQQTRIELV